MVSKIVFATNYSTVTTTTCYNAAGQTLSTVQKKLISQLSPTLESKSVFVSERGLTSTQWSEYSENTKRIQYSAVPTSDITAEAVTVDGVALSQKDTAGVVTTATRPLAIQKDGTWYTYGWDLTKNICELYGQHGYIRTAYTYTPYGQVTEEDDVEQSPRGLGGGLDKPRSEFAPQGRAGNGVPASQPIQWSSEFNDTELGLVYYNYRHYNPVDGRWIGRDLMPKFNLYLLHGCPLQYIDVLGKNTLKISINVDKSPTIDEVTAKELEAYRNKDNVCGRIEQSGDGVFATTHVYIPPSNIYVRCKGTGSCFRPHIIKIKASILILINEPQTTSRYFNPVVGYSFPSPIPFRYIPSNDGYSQANPRYVMLAELNHFDDLYAWLTGKELKQNISTAASNIRKSATKGKQECEAALMFLVKTVLRT